MKIEDFVTDIMCLNRVRSIAELSEQAPAAGAIVELGCHEGHTAALLRWKFPDRDLFVYDAFPKDFSEFISNHCEKELETDFVIGISKVFETFKKLGLRAPGIHAGWFEDTLPHSLPEQIAFAHLDSDHEKAMRLSIEAVYPRLVPGAICVIDDYDFDYFAGVKRSVNEFMDGKPEGIVTSVHKMQAYFRKA